MADLGGGVSYVYDSEGYNYDMVVFQKGKPPLDSELNLAQELQNIIAQRNLRTLPSGWLSFYPPYADRSLAPSATSVLRNKFYTQNPTGAKPEFALVNGYPIYVTNTAAAGDNANLIDLLDPPATGNRVNGVFLEAWRALIDPSTSLNKPLPATIIDTFFDIYMYNENYGWICGDNGLILKTTTGGATWPVMPVDTKRALNGIHFYNLSLGWVVGDSGVIARSSSGGISWTLLTPATTVNLNSVHAINQTLVWAVGDNGVILKAANGVTFVPVSSGVTNNLNKVYFSDQNHGWIVGDNGLILVTSNGGVTWSTSSSGTTQNLNSVYFYNVNFGFAVGNNGVILRSSDGGASWINQSGHVAGGAITNNLYGVNMFPKLDEAVVGEEVSSQLGPLGTSFNLMHTPVTGADRKGAVTNNPSDIIVKVNGSPVTVLSVNGLTGVVVLAAAPGLGAVTKVDYFYQADCAVFEGKAWIVGATGVVLSTDDIGSTWTPRTSGTAYNIKSLSFVSQTTGWFCGAESIIRNTTDGGVTWVQQQSDIFARSVQRVYTEGNTGSTNEFLNENSIHPDAQIVTTKRVQIQYKIRVIEAADPMAYPESGLGSAGILGVGPNTTGSFAYENMGPINGDYGCWRARCLNTVDGYVYAIPMFFAGRRNTTAYSTSNTNGQHIKNSANIRPDLLLATNVVMADILDVRRRVVIPCALELLTKTFDSLSSNVLRTNLGRSSSGDQYGTELLQVDSLTGTSISGPLTGKYTSASQLNMSDTTVTASTTLPVSSPLNTVGTGIFYPDPSFYRASYASGSIAVDGKSIPGQFQGFGTSDASFVFNNNALTKNLDGALTGYIFKAPFITDNTTALTYTPSDPQLVINTNGSQSFIYQGVMDSVEAKTLEFWDSGISSYPNYSLVYSARDITDTIQMNRSSPVEVHYFVRTDSSNLSGGILTITNAIVADSDSSAVPYNIKTVRQVYNRTSGFSHKLSSITFGPNTIAITPIAGYEFINGTILEITADVLSSVDSLNIRNGAAVNFNQRLKSASTFTKSLYLSNDATANQVTLTPSDATILGWSTTETASSLNQAVCWSSIQGMVDVAVTNNTSNIVLSAGSLSGTISMQVLVRETALTYPTDTLNIAYHYVPSQGQILPSSLTVEPISGTPNLYVSTSGLGGGMEGEPYVLPLEQIAINDVNIANDQQFNNLIQMKFANFMVDSGFVQLPVTIPGNFYGSTITLSSPSYDNLKRTFYSVCSNELKFQAEGLQLPVARKVYIPILARVMDASGLFLKGEYVLLIFSRPVSTDAENKTGYFANSNCSISVYRLSNRPLSRD